MFKLSQAGKARTLSLVEASPLRRFDPRAKLALSLCVSLMVMLPLERLALFCLLEAILGAFTAGVDMASSSRLVVQHKESLTFLLPQSYGSRIAQVEGFANHQPQDLGGPRRLLGALRRGAAGTGFPARQIDDPGPATPARQFDQRSARRQFDIVGMSGNGQHIELL